MPCGFLLEIQIIFRKSLDKTIKMRYNIIPFPMRQGKDGIARSRSAAFPCGIRAKQEIEVNQNALEAKLQQKSSREPRSLFCSLLGACSLKKRSHYAEVRQ